MFEGWGLGVGRGSHEGSVKGSAQKGGGPERGIILRPETTDPSLLWGLGPPSPTGSGRDDGDEEAAAGVGAAARGWGGGGAAAQGQGQGQGQAHLWAVWKPPRGPSQGERGVRSWAGEEALQGCPRMPGTIWAEQREEV